MPQRVGQNRHTKQRKFTITAGSSAYRMSISISGYVQIAALGSIREERDDSVHVPAIVAVATAVVVVPPLSVLPPIVSTIIAPTVPSIVAVAAIAVAIVTAVVAAVIALSACSGLSTVDTRDLSQGCSMLPVHWLSLH